MNNPICNGRDDCSFNISKVEDLYQAKYVGQFCLKTRSGVWADAEVSVFYTPTPSKPEYSNYFALFVQDGKVMISDACCIAEGTFTGVIADNGDIVYSRYLHDCRWSPDGSVMIDGGRDYARLGGQVHINFNDRVVDLSIVDGEFVVSRSVDK